MSPRKGFAIAALCASSLACTTGPRQSVPPPDGRFGNVYLAAERFIPDTRKMVALSYRIATDKMAVANVVIAYGAAPSLPSGRADYSVELLGSDGRVLAGRTAADPRRIIVEREGNTLLPEGMLTTRIAFDPAVVKARLRRASDGAVVEHDIREAVSAFCSRNRDDPDCATALATPDRPRSL